MKHNHTTATRPSTKLRSTGAPQRDTHHKKMMAQGFSSLVALVCLLLVASASAFVAPSARVSALAPRASAAASATASTSALRTSSRSSRGRSALFMAEEEEVVEEVVEAAQDTKQSVQSFFAPNENIRRGSSRDQDGKSNVWAVEPKMMVEGTDVETPKSNNLLVVGGIIGVLVVAMSATIAFLPSPDSI